MWCRRNAPLSQFRNPCPDDLLRMFSGQFGQVIKNRGKRGQSLAERAQFRVKAVQRRLRQQGLNPLPARPIRMRRQAKDLSAP